VVPWREARGSGVPLLLCQVGVRTDGARCSWLTKLGWPLLIQQGVGFCIDGLMGQVLGVNGWVVDRTIPGHLHREMARFGAIWVMGLITAVAAPIL